MTDVLLATNQDDAEAVEHIRDHHAAMQGSAVALAGRLRAAASAEDAWAARDALARWARQELVPHALAEERTLYAAAGGVADLRLLVEAMIGEHAALGAQVLALEESRSPIDAVAASGALVSLLATHVEKENELLLPALAAAPEHSLAALLQQMGEQIGQHAPAESEGGCGGGCACGEQDTAEPELDARDIPHAIRHATILGALDTVAPGRGMVLIAPHDPLPLLKQIEGRWPGGFEVSYQQRGPEAWRLHFARR